MTLLPSNEVILKKRFPEVLSRISSLESKNFSVKSQKPFAINYEGNEFHPYGFDHSKELVAAWIKSLIIKNDSCNITFGFGNGFHIENILDKLDSNSVLLVVEQDPAWLKEIFQKVDCSKLLKNSQFFLATGEINEEFFTVFKDMDLVFNKALMGFIYSPLYSLNEDYYKKVLKSAEHYYTVYKRLQQTNVDDSGFWQNVIFDNLPYTIEAPDISILKDQFKNLPIILVSAGPSLDESIEFIKQAKDHALIICVNSAYRKLIHNNIYPHITLAADPREDTFKGYLNCPLDDVYLISPYFVNQQVVQSFSGRNFTWTGNNPLIQTIRKRLGQSPGTFISERGTISACIADVAEILGCKKICLVGQDLAITESGQTHTNDSFYADEQRLHMDIKNCRRVEGNTIPSIPSEEKLFIYLKIFEQMIAFHPNIEFINTARLGARISGATYYTYDKAIEWLGSETNSYVNGILKNLSNQKSENIEIREKIIIALQSTYNFTEKVWKLAKEASDFLETLPPKLEKQNYQQHAALKKVAEMVHKFNQFLNNNAEDYQILAEGVTKKELFNYRENTKFIKAETQHWHDVLQNRMYFKAILAGSEFLLGQLKKYI